MYSGPFRFAFDAQHPSGLGYVLPTWLHQGPQGLRLPPPPAGAQTWRTVINLPLRPDMAVRG